MLFRLIQEVKIEIVIQLTRMKNNYNRKIENKWKVTNGFILQLSGLFMHLFGTAISNVHSES